MKSIGLIGLDTTHVVEFTKLLNDETHEHHVKGGRVTTAWPGGSPDFALSANRVEGFTKELQEKHGITIAASPEAVAEEADIVFIEAVDGRTHRGLLERTLPFGKPTFVDKPFALTTEDALAMLAAAEKAGVPLMSSSALRYADQLVAALANGRDGILGCEIFGPAAEEPTQPGLFWYGCHSIEMMLAIMGPGCRTVRCVRTDTHDALTAVWADGRVATYHGLRKAHWKFGATLHRADGVQSVDPSNGRPFYVGLLEAVMANLPAGRSGIPLRETLEVVAILDGGNRSAANDGGTVSLPAV